MFIIILIVLFILIVGIHFRSKNRKFYELAKKFKHDLKTYPILGISYLFFGNSEDQMKGYQLIGRETIKKGGIIAAWFGPKLYFSVTDPVIVEFVLKNCLEKDDLTRFARIALGNGTIFAPLSIWHRRRKTLAPSFKPKNMLQFIHIFSAQSNVLVERLRTNAGKGLFSLWNYMLSFSLDSVCHTSMGIPLNVQKEMKHPFLEAFSEGFRLTAARTCQPWLHSDVIYNILPQYKALRSYVVYAYNFIGEMINKKREELNAKQNANDSEAFENGTDKNFKPLLELLLQSSGNRQRYSDLELQEEMLTLMVAGTDTSAAGIAFTMLLLARHADVQERVYEELKDVFGESKRAVEPDDLPRLKYLEVVIKEILRLYPPGFGVLRKVTTDVMLPNGIMLPKGCGLIINIWGIHRDPEYWGGDAEQFRPERFLETPLKHPVQYIPFSHGPRNCVGSQYAMLSIKTCLATILRYYRVLPMTPKQQVTNNNGPEPLRLKLDIIMKDADHFMVALEERSNDVTSKKI